GRGTRVRRRTCRAGRGRHGPQSNHRQHSAHLNPSPDSGAHRMSLAAFAIAIDELCHRIETRQALPNCNCGCERAATHQCTWCEEHYAEACAARSYCFAEEGPVCDACREDHFRECEECSERAHADWLEARAEALRS